MSNGFHKMQEDIIKKNLRIKKLSAGIIMNSKKDDQEGTKLLPNIIFDHKLTNSYAFHYNMNIVGYASIDYLTDTEEGRYGFYSFYVYKDYRNMGLNRIFLLKLLKELEVNFVITIVDEKSYYAYNSLMKAGFLKLPEDEINTYVNRLKKEKINLKPNKTFLIFINVK